MNKTSKIILGVIIAIVVVGGIWYGVSKNQTPAEKSPIKVGVILPLTGTSADAAEYAKKGLSLALKEINSDNTKNKIELVFEDSQYKNDAAVTAVNKLISFDGVKYIIGDYGSSQTLAIAPIAEQNKIILITPTSQASGITKAGDYVFRTQINTADEAKYFADFLVGKIGSDRLSIIAINTDYGADYINDFSTAFKEKGGNLGIIQKIESTASDFRTEILKSQNDNAKHILLITNRKIGGQIIKQASELKTQFNFFATSPIEGNELIQIAGAAADGLIYPYPFNSNSADDYQQQFQNKYANEYGGIKAEMVAANAYDTLMILNKCFNNVGIDTESVKNCLYNTQNYSGASGLISFDKNGDVQKPLIIKAIKNGQFTEVK